MHSTDWIMLSGKTTVQNAASGVPVSFLFFGNANTDAPSTISAEPEPSARSPLSTGTNLGAGALNS